MLLLPRIIYSTDGRREWTYREIQFSFLESSFRSIRRYPLLCSTKLDRFALEAKGRGFDAATRLEEGHIVEEVLKFSKHFELLVLGHRGREDRKLPSNILLGSVAERVVVGANLPVLIAVQPVDQIEQILVAYDGSEASRGALLMAENFAKNAGAKLKAMVVVHDAESKAGAKVLVEEGEKFLREYWEADVFSIKEGAISSTLLESAEKSNSLLVLWGLWLQKSG